MNIDKLFDLQEKTAAGVLTEAEAAELESMTVSDDGKATGAQRDYIELLLDQLGADLEDYTNVALDALTLEEASELIDDMKDELGYD